MSKVMNIKRLVLFLGVFFSLALSMNAQPRGSWEQRMKAEKIAYITTELALTVEEAQAFWPIYNKAEQEKNKYNAEVLKAYAALEVAFRKNSKDAAYDKLLSDYVNATAKAGEVDKKYVDQYKKVLPVEKVAKLFVAEEGFRRAQFMKMGQGRGQRPEQPQ